MMPRGGRRTRVEEDKITSIASAAIEKKFGSLENGFNWLLESGEPSLVRFAFEHAAGKPREKHSVAHELPTGQSFKIGGQVIEF